MSQAVADYHFLKLNQDILKNPYPFYTLLREQAPLFREPDYGVLLVSRYADILEVNRQPTVFSSVLVANAPYVDLPAPVDELAAWRAKNPYGDKILSNDPPDHTRHKRMINRFFTPRRVTDMETRVRYWTNLIIDEFIDRGQVEFVTEFAHMLPRLIVGELIGVPDEDHARFRQFFGERLKRMAEAAANPTAGFATRTTDREEVTEDSFIRTYFENAIHERRANPRGDIMSDLAQARFEDGELLPIASLVSMISLLYSAGGDANTPELMTNSMLVLLRNPALMQALRDDPSLAEGFIEEVLRYDTPVPGVFRIATQDTTVGGVSVEKGSKLMVVYGAANHDASQFPDPESFDMNRSFRTNAHLGFGYGVHFCPGAALARQEGKVAIQEVLRRMDNIRRAEPGEPPYVPSVIQRIPIRLLLDFDKRA